MKAVSFIRNAFLLSLLTSTLAFAEGTKVAYVHLERAINEVDDGVKAKGDLQKEMDQKKIKLEKMHKDLQSLAESVEKQSAVMSQEARQAKAKEYQKKATEFQQEYAATEQEFMKRKNEVMAPIVQKMQALVGAMRTEGKYDAIGDRGAMIDVKPELDLTNELIRRYNSAHGKGVKTSKK